MLRESLKDAGQIIQCIISQPLSVVGASSKEISMLAAAKSFNPNDPASSDLKKILETLQQYPEATEVMIQELKILCDELA